MEYLVTWTIEVTADGPEQAAAMAQEMMRDHGVSWSFVIEGLGRAWTVDLVEEEPVASELPV
jgi:hypothetical protein